MTTISSLLQSTYKRIDEADNKSAELAKVIRESNSEEIGRLLQEGADDASDQRAYLLALQNISSFMASLQLRNEAEPAFYEALWSMLSTSPMYADDAMRKAGMLVLMTHPSLPYFELDGFDMSWEEFTARAEAHEEECALLQRMQYREFPNAGSAASAMLQVVTSPADYRDQVALMTHLVSLLQSNADGASSAED